MAKHTSHWRLITLLLLLAGLLGCGGNPEIKIGLIVPFGGDMDQLGNAARNAAQLAVNEVNANGGLEVNGRKYTLTLLIENNLNSPEQSVAAAQRLINQENVVALVGPMLDQNAIPVAAVAESAGVPMISPTSTSPETTAGRRYVYRATYTSNFQGEVMARFTFENLSSQTIPRAAVLYNIADPYSVGIAEAFKNVYTAAGGRMAVYESYTTDINDFTSQMEQIEDAGNLEVIVLPNYPNEVFRQVQQAREMGIYQTIIAGDALNEVTPGRFPELNRIFLVAPWHPDLTEARSQAFTQDFTAAYGSTPSSAAALTYDSFQMLFQAMQNQGATDSESINNGLASLGRYEGVTGVIEYQGSGDPVKGAVVLQILGDRFALITTFSP